MTLQLGRANRFKEYLLSHQDQVIRVVCHWCLFWLGSVFLSRKLHFIFLPLALRFAHQNQLIRLVCHWCAIWLGWHSLAGSCAHLSSSSAIKTTHFLTILEKIIFLPSAINTTDYLTRTKWSNNCAIGVLPGDLVRKLSLWWKLYFRYHHLPAFSYEDY